MSSRKAKKQLKKKDTQKLPKLSNKSYLDDKALIAALIMRGDGFVENTNDTNDSEITSVSNGVSPTDESLFPDPVKDNELLKRLRKLRSEPASPTASSSTNLSSNSISSYTQEALRQLDQIQVPFSAPNSPVLPDSLSSPASSNSSNSDKLKYISRLLDLGGKKAAIAVAKIDDLLSRKLERAVRIVTRALRRNDNLSQTNDNILKLLKKIAIDLSKLEPHSYDAVDMPNCCKQIMTRLDNIEKDIKTCMQQPPPYDSNSQGDVTEFLQAIQMATNTISGLLATAEGIGRAIETVRNQTFTALGELNQRLNTTSGPAPMDVDQDQDQDQASGRDELQNQVQNIQQQIINQIQSQTNTQQVVIQNTNTLQLVLQQLQQVQQTQQQIQANIQPQTETQLINRLTREEFLELLRKFLEQLQQYQQAQPTAAPIQQVAQQFEQNNYIQIIQQLEQNAETIVDMIEDENQIQDQIETSISESNTTISLPEQNVQNDIQSSPTTQLALQLRNRLQNAKEESEESEESEGAPSITPMKRKSNDVHLYPKKSARIITQIDQQVEPRTFSLIIGNRKAADVSISSIDQYKSASDACKILDQAIIDMKDHISEYYQQMPATDNQKENRIFGKLFEIIVTGEQKSTLMIIWPSKGGEFFKYLALFPKDSSNMFEQVLLFHKHGNVRKCLVLDENFETELKYKLAKQFDFKSEHLSTIYQKLPPHFKRLTSENQ